MAKKKDNERSEKLDWHRFFSVVMYDLFFDSPFEVEWEKDLSIQQQFLDLVIIRRRAGEWTMRLPDGFEDLADHNLVTFKSFQEALDAWAMKELVSHYVTYRKLLRKGNEPFLPEDRFRLYAVCSRFPHNLSQQVKLTEVQKGVYECVWGTDKIRIIVASQLSDEVHNTGLHAVSASLEKVAYARAHFRLRSPHISTLLLQLFHGYEVEGLQMPFKIEDFDRVWIEKNKDWLMDLIPAEERVKGMTPEQIKAHLTPAQRVEGLTTEELVQVLSPERKEQLLKQLAASVSPSNPKKNGNHGRKSPKKK
jgi:hypothetical protein